MSNYDPFELYLTYLLFKNIRPDRMAQLLDERDLGVLTSAMSLLVALVSNNHDAYWSCVPKCVKILERLARNQDVPQDYTYYGIPSPWLQVHSPFPYLYTNEQTGVLTALFSSLFPFQPSSSFFEVCLLNRDSRAPFSFFGAYILY